MTLFNYKKIFILAGETSGDYIGREIMKGLKENQGKKISFFGIGGSLMKKEGLDCILDMNDFNIIGFLNTLYNYRKLNNYKNSIINHILNEKPDAILTIDTKGFSLALAKKLKILFNNNHYKCPLIHFVPPTIWAYGESRVNKWRNLHDGLFCLFKAEEYIFKQYDINCIYVGNPIIEKFIEFNKNKRDIIKLNKKYKINSNDFTCLLFPGSRDSEIKYILSEFIILIKSYKQNIKNIRWIIPTTILQYPKIIKIINNNGLSDKVSVIIFNDNYDILKCSDTAIACSGTITLELALFGLPTIAVYKTDLLSSIIGRLIVNFKNVILPNFLLERKLIPFLFQEKCKFYFIDQFLQQYLKDIDIKKKIFKEASNDILKKMKYNSNHNFNFSKSSSQEIIKIINKFNY